MKFFSLRRLLGCPLFWSNSGLFRAPRFIVSPVGKKGEKKENGKEGKRNRKGKEVRKEEGIKKKKEGEKWKRNFKKSFAGFKLVRPVLLVFLSVKWEWGHTRPGLLQRIL